MDPANSDEALREVALDDVLHRVKERFGIRSFACQVSGEYAMLKAAAGNGWLDGRSCVLEALAGIERAGADAGLSCFALDAARWLAGGEGA
ncbi:MAG TPA: hypothetical protein PKZ08_12235 [Vicinamibacterales bacterium]|nr:hypothetical protein [Vicinamibacterales bacterium]